MAGADWTALHLRDCLVDRPGGFCVASGLGL
jgi:hypothetical protein